jgi:hypothetical protein
MITASTMAHIIASGEKPQLEIELHPVLRVPSSLKTGTSTTKNTCKTNQCNQVCIVRNKMPQAYGIPRNQVPAWLLTGEATLKFWDLEANVLLRGEEGGQHAAVEVVNDSQN